MLNISLTSNKTHEKTDKLYCLVNTWPEDDTLKNAHLITNPYMHEQILTITASSKYKRQKFFLLSDQHT